MKLFLIVILFVSGHFAIAQNIKTIEPPKRILLLLDGSGSMLEDWNGITKWMTAKKIISQTIDSIQKVDPTIEIGLRVFGHQSPRVMKDCKDSKLEVLIAKNTSAQIKTKLAEIIPKGNTPIAYSLFLAAGDFNENEAINSIILITDGIENCDGDPCANSEILSIKKITLKPFIIGLGLNTSDKNKFDCVGTFYDATNEVGFKNALNVIISQATNSTTAQINLLDAYGKPLETNVELTLYDAYSGEVRYNFVHSLNSKNEPDTLLLDPLGKYTIVAHTTPSVTKKFVELNPGKHTIIGIDVPQGTLQLTEIGTTGFSTKQCVVRNTSTNEIVYLQNANTKQKYIADKYTIQILTLPVIEYKNYALSSNTINEIKFERHGTLSVTSADNMLMSIYTTQENTLQKLYEGTINKTIVNVDLQPGEYTIIYRSNTDKRSENTVEMMVTIKSSKTTALKLQ